ncbi:hypothetical protein [Telluribacter humicola]|uniref:hypothetical protein n=1 Tax=Telluribacter humicola TaxID=1720261 RepID=UPI001A966024|nr:hypothetical protein [Telluribacter humicola]
MKKLSTTMMFILLIGLVTLPEFAGAVQSATVQTDSTKASSGQPAFQVGMYQSIHSLTMNVLVEKALGCRVRVKLLNKRGDVLFDEMLNKSQQKYRLKLNFAEVPDGTYTVVVANETGQITKSINLFSQALYEMPTRTLLVMN